MDFFFVLSGFVLAKTYWTESRRFLIFQNVAERIARLYPLHFVTLLIVAVGQWILAVLLGQDYFIYTFNDSYHFVLNLGLANYLGPQAGYSFNGPAWSISTEFLAGVVFLLLILLPRRAALTSVCCLVLMSVTVFNGILNPLLLRTVVGFCVGVLLHQLVYPFRRALKPLHYDLLLVTAVAAFAVYTALPWEKNYRGQDFFVDMVVFPAMVLAAQLGRHGTAILRAKPLVFLGTISYSIYLVHFPLQLLLKIVQSTFGITLPYHGAFFLAAFLGFTILTATVAHRYIEVPGKAWIRSWMQSSTSRLKAAG